MVLTSEVIRKGSRGYGQDYPRLRGGVLARIRTCNFSVASPCITSSHIAINYYTAVGSLYIEDGL